MPRGAASIVAVTTAAGVRIGWDDLPQHVRDAVSAIVGGPVVAAVSQSGGFSPGTADRIRTADGTRAFVKAVSSAQNEQSPGLHRREAVVTAALSASVPAPAFLGLHDDGDWVALVLEDVEGRHPATPWEPAELTRVLAVLADLAAVTTPTPLDLEPAGTALTSEFGGWDRLAADPPAELDPWAAAHLDELRALAARGHAAVAGDTLVHMDVRADNLLLRPDGGVTIVDWPWACRGAAWLDSLLVLINVRLYGGHDVHALLAETAAAFGADPADLIAAMAGLSGFFADAARRPPPPGLPTVRAFQQSQADVTLAWLRETHVA